MYNTLKTYNNQKYGHKDIEFLKFIELPTLTKQKIELINSQCMGMQHVWVETAKILKAN